MSTFDQSAPITQSAPLALPPARLPASAIFTDSFVIAKRNLLFIIRTPQLLVFSTIQPVMFVLLFRFVFGGAINVPTESYASSLLPGVFVQTVVSFKDAAINSLDGANVLTLVVETDARPWLSNGRGPMFGAVGETVVAGKLPIRLERVGRPEIKNVIMSEGLRPRQPRSGDPRPLQPGRRLPPEQGLPRRLSGAAERQPRFYRPPGRQDGLAARAERHPPAHRAAAGRLPGGRRLASRSPRTATSRSSGRRSQGRPHETCGGRSLNEDVMDTLYTLMINAGNGPRISDGVDQATSRPRTSSPTWRRPMPRRRPPATGRSTVNATPP